MKKPVTLSGIEYTKIENRSNSLYLTWVMNNICTNSCSYCPEDLHTGKNHHYEWNHAKKFLKDCFDRYGKVQCSISGGEPTVSPFFKEIVDLIYDNGGLVVLTTNFARSVSWWKDVAPKISSLSCSYHPEFMPTKEFDDSLIEKITEAAKVTCVTVRVMMHPDYWDQCMNFFKRIQDSGIECSAEIVRILDNFGIGEAFCVINYTEEQERILREVKPYINWPNNLPDTYRHNVLNSYLISETNEIMLDFPIASEISNTMNNDFNGWNCKIGLESLFVHYDGNVQRGNCGVGGHLGNITTKINWPTESIICNKTVCHCLADVLMSKEIT